MTDEEVKVWDYYAAAALQGYLAGFATPGAIPVVERAAKFADMMMQIRKPGR